MPAAYTLYKLGKLIPLVFAIFVILAIYSVINPAKEEATAQVVKQLDSTGQASKVLEVQQSIPDPEGAAKQEAGNVLYRMLQNNPHGFILLVLIVAGILFVLGVRLQAVRAFLSRLR